MVGAPKLQAYIYIYHLGLQFNLPTLPESLTDTMNLSFEQTPVLARSAPQITFGGAGPRTFQVQIQLHRHLFTLENPQTQALLNNPRGYVQLPNPVTGNMQSYKAVDAVDILVNALLSLSLPKYTDSTKSIVPPSLLIRYGDELAIRGVPANVQKMTKGPWLKSNKQADVQVSFQVTEVEPYSAQYVAQYGSLRGLSTTLQRSSVWQW